MRPKDNSRKSGTDSGRVLKVTEFHFFWGGGGKTCHNRLKIEGSFNFNNCIFVLDSFFVFHNDKFVLDSDLQTVSLPGGLDNS